MPRLHVWQKDHQDWLVGMQGQPCHHNDDRQPGFFSLTTEDLTDCILKNPACEVGEREPIKEASFSLHLYVKLYLGRYSYLETVSSSEEKLSTFFCHILHVCPNNYATWENWLSVQMHAASCGPLPRGKDPRIALTRRPSPLFPHETCASSSSGETASCSQISCGH